MKMAMKGTAIFYPLKLRAFLTCTLMLLASCAAMRRTWQFHAEPVATAASSPGFEVRVRSAAVTQHRVAIELTLHNTGTQPLTVQCENASLTLPDGATFTSSFGNVQSDMARRLAVIGIGKAGEPLTIAPGASAPLELSISQGRRDLRRFPKLLIQFIDLKLGGEPVSLPPLQLLAPPEAPLGEDI